MHFPNILSQVPGFILLEIEVQGDHSMPRAVIVVILVLLCLAVLPTWPYSAGWGYYPSGGLGLIVLIVLILILVKRV
jgi:Protein of unknown function (DUF3309)